MRQFFKICTLVLLFASCGQNDTKQKELELKERELAIREKELQLKGKDTAIAKTDSTKSSQVQVVKQTEPNTKIMTMTFEEYSEGDYPHFIFKETSTGKTYDFRHISDNQLGNVKVLLNDDDASFGLKANPKYLKKSFTVEAVNKTVLDYDLDGKTIKTKDWVIKSIKPSEGATSNQSNNAQSTGDRNKFVGTFTWSGYCPNGCFYTHVFKENGTVKTTFETARSSETFNEKWIVDENKKIIKIGNENWRYEFNNGKIKLVSVQYPQDKHELTREK